MTNEEATPGDHTDGRKMDTSGNRSSRQPNTDQNSNTLSPVCTEITEEEEDNGKVKWRLQTVKSSDTFDRIMGDIEVKMTERLKQIEAMKNVKKTENAAAEQPVLLELDFPEEDDDEEDSVNGNETYNHPKRIKARRAWALVRRHIREQAMEKQNKSSLQWSMLKQTIKNMSNMEAGRETLYQKYLDPNKPRVWTEGIKSIPTDFWARHSKVIARARDKDKEQGRQKGRNKPRSAKSYTSVRTSYSTNSSLSVKTIR